MPSGAVRNSPPFSSTAEPSTSTVKSATTGSGSPSFSSKAMNSEGLKSLRGGSEKTTLASLGGAVSRLRWMARVTRSDQSVLFGHRKLSLGVNGRERLIWISSP